MVKKPIRLGLSLVELIVSIGIISILIGLLLPAVNAARGVARRIDCASRMRQISMASMMHHDVNRVLPSGTYLEKTGTPFQGWFGRLLPFIEQNEISNTSETEFYNGLEFLDHSQFAVPITLFACPEDSRVTESQYSLRHGYRVALTSFQGCNGTDYVSKNGVMYYGSKTKFRDIFDGVSNTLLVGERPPSTYFDYGWWYAGKGVAGTGTLDHSLGVDEIAKSRYASCLGPGRPKGGNTRNECSAEHFWSLHPSGMHFARTDASVAFYQYNTEFEVLKALSTRDGSESIRFDDQ